MPAVILREISIETLREIIREISVEISDNISGYVVIERIPTRMRMWKHAVEVGMAMGSCVRHPEAMEPGN